MHSYWRRSHAYLHHQLQGVCVYTGCFTPRASRQVSGPSSSSIDHYVPKSHDPKLAFEWANFRLCRASLNHRKADHRDVIDPVTLQGRWFVLDLITFRVEPNQTLVMKDQQAADATIRRLALNDDDELVAERARVVFGYAAGNVPRTDLKGKFPFIESELSAQEFEQKHMSRFQSLLTNARVRASLASQGWI
jgi:uncharacterized protein (TIGR02646 family)